MEAQELYNLCAGHLLKQGRQSKDGTGCVYRSDSGLMCGAGPAIPDHLYHPNMEENTILTVVEEFEDLAYLIPHKKMLRDIQCLHDCMDDDTLTELFGRPVYKYMVVDDDEGGMFVKPILKEGLDNIAKRYGLEPLPPLEG